MIQWILAIWSLVLLPFLKSTWTSGSSWFMYAEAWLENFNHGFTSLWDECNYVVVWTFFGIASFGIGMKTDLFQSCGHCWVFQLCCHIKYSTFTASSFRIWNSSTGIPSSLLALLVVMLPKAHLTCIPGCLALGEWSHHHDYLGQEDFFLYSSSVYSCHLFLISSASVRSIPFLFYIVPILHENFPWNL